MSLIDILKQPVTEEVLGILGFSEYDDEHCTWGNRRLRFGEFVRDEYDKWYVLQILDFGDYPEENDRPEGYSYCGWFEFLPPFKPTNENGKIDHRIGWDLITVRDIYKIFYLYHKQWLP